MRSKLFLFFWMVCAVLVLTLPASAQEIRDASRKADADLAAAREAAQEVQARIARERKALTQRARSLAAQETTLAAEVKALQGQVDAKLSEESELSAKWKSREQELSAIAGTVRVSARDLQSLLQRSPLTAFSKKELESLQPVLNKDHFPGLNDITGICGTYLDEARKSGKASVREGSFSGRSGKEEEGKILTLGKFSSAYEDGNKVGFLEYREKGHQFQALAASPSSKVRKNLKKFINGKTDSVYLDFSGGGALQQIVQKKGFWAQILAGGPIVWPILAIALVSIVLILERFRYFYRIRGNTDSIMEAIKVKAGRGDWSGCRETLASYRKRDWPVVNVLAAGLDGREESREIQENILQEAILREVPRLEHFLTILGILAAIAPLLGLLGTVTGMIETFQVITLHGSGEPRMMSGGISEALITTELGLAVAIPIMLFHGLLSRFVEHNVSDMEEKSVALITLMQKDGNQHGSALQHG